MTMLRFAAPIWLTTDKCHAPGLVSKQSADLTRPVLGSAAGSLSLQRPPINFTLPAAFAHNNEPRALMSDG